MVLDNSEYGGKPKARSLSHLPRGEKRVEDLRLGLIIHANPAIGYGQPTVIAMNFCAVKAHNSCNL